MIERLFAAIAEGNDIPSEARAWRNAALLCAVVVAGVWAVLEGVSTYQTHYAPRAWYAFELEDPYPGERAVRLPASAFDDSSATESAWYQSGPYESEAACRSGLQKPRTDRNVAACYRITIASATSYRRTGDKPR